MTTTAPTFVLAGAARAGTTAVIEALRSHPQVFVTRPKEPHYLALGGSPVTFTGPDDDVTVNRVTVTDESDYLALFDAGRHSAERGEGSVSTLYYHETALPRLRKLNPEAKLILVLREPVARAYSSHQYLVNRGSEPVPDFLDAVSEEPARIARGWHHLWHYTRMSRYADAVEHCIAEFGRDQVGIWWYDDLAVDPAACLTEIHEFLGVDAPDPATLPTSRVNSSGTPRRRWLQSAIQQAAGHELLSRAVRATVPFQVRERVRNANLTRSDVPEQVRRQLAPSFDADLTRLETVLGTHVPPGWR